MKQTNIVFWILVIAFLAIIWFLMSFCFKGIGRFLAGLWNDAKKDMEEENETNKEEKES